MSETEQLLPCPFCGSIAIAEHEQDCRDAETYYWFVCGGCGCETEGAHGRKSAIASWNTRASPAPAASRADLEERLPAICARFLCEEEGAEWAGLDNYRADVERWFDRGHSLADRILSALPDAPVPAKDVEGEG